jgi:uncharacterized membrane protein
MVWSRALFVLFVLAVGWTVSIFVAPMTIAPGTFAFTTGNANRVDHWDLYAGPEFNWYAKVVYTLGDAECHQLWYRSLWINGNQMPVDARDTSLFLFGTFGLFWAMMVPASVFVSRGLVNAFPPRVQRAAARIGVLWFALLVVALGILPVAVDGFAQLLTPYESSNSTRVLTGIPGGLVVGLLVGMMIKSIRQASVESRAVRRATAAPAPTRSASGGSPPRRPGA